MKLTARAVKATLVISPDELVGIIAEGQKRIPFTIDVDGRRITGEFNGKSVRKAIATCAAGEAAAVVIQGTLRPDGRLENAGITAPPRGGQIEKPAAERADESEARV
jgi:hypothetical protein